MRISENFIRDLAGWRWLSLAGLTLALLAQYLLEPPAYPAAALAFYVAAFGFIIWAALNGEWQISDPQAGDVRIESHQVRWLPLLISLPLLAASYYFFDGNRFTGLNLSLWLSGILLFVSAFWESRTPTVSVRSLDWEWIILLCTVFALAAFFRFYRLGEVPAEPFSDHAEKILDVYDVSQGKYSIFFERNTGREAFQMYWTYLTALIFGTGYSFLSLKIGTAILGFLTLPFVYRLGRELGNPLTGLLALFLFGVSYWPNVIARIGLRFPLYPLFAAATLFYLVRGLRTQSRNDFLLCGLFLGLGLHGYTPFRIMPFVVVVGGLVYILHTPSGELRRRSLLGLGVTSFTSFILFLPLLRYWLEHPATFEFRALSRLVPSASTEPLPLVFMKNLVNALLMFNFDDGDIWVNSITHRPALDVVGGALFLVGFVLILLRYLRGRDWRDLFVLISIPLLLMPSVLSIAFPIENPALNRAGGAAVMAVIIGAAALEGWLAGAGGGRLNQVISYGLAAVLLSASAMQNYDLVFNEFSFKYRLAVWNSTEMAQVIKAQGDIDASWIVPYWQWVDTRLPAIQLGFVDRDLALWPDDIASTRSVPGPKLFIFNTKDAQTEISLKLLYPDGVLSRYTSATPGKDFMIFVVKSKK